MTFREFITFVGQTCLKFPQIGAAFPTSKSGCIELIRVARQNSQPKTVLEVGAGTGTVTKFLVEALGPNDTLVICEINPSFVNFLAKRLRTDPHFSGSKAQIQVICASVLDLPASTKFNHIISSLPMSAFSHSATERIFDKYLEMLHPGGSLSFIEYSHIRRLRCWVAQNTRIGRSFLAVGETIERFIKCYSLNETVIWKNFPPATVHHLGQSSATNEVAVTKHLYTVSTASES